MAYSLYYSQELIKYNLDDYYVKDCEDIIEDIFIDIQNGTYKDNKSLIKFSSHIKELQKLIKKRFNINAFFPVEFADLGYDAAVLPILGDSLTYSIYKGFFLNGFSYADMVKKIKEITATNNSIMVKNHLKKGYVDFKNAKIGGYLAEYEQNFIMDFFSLKNRGLTPIEVVAVLTHEIGHVFHGLSEHFHLERVNSIYMDIIKEIADNKLDRAIYVYNNKVANEKEFQVKALSESTTREDFNHEVVSSYVDITRAQVINSKYLETDFEAIADNFVVKFGLGDSLASALSKFPNGYVAINVMTTVSTIYFLALILMTGSLISIAAVGSIYLLFVYFLEGDDNVNMTYDVLKERYERIYIAMIQALKPLDKLNDKTIKDLVEKITAIKKIMDEAPDLKIIDRFVANAIFKRHRDAKYYRDLQRFLERGLNTELYFDAARIKTS